jgi:MarR family 2-MHQ and catechol resistance regulon transcriptional repressor
MPTRFQGSPEEVRALNAFIALMRAVNSVTASLAPRRAAEGLTTTQFGVLEALLHLGPQGQCGLAGKLLTSPGNLVLVLDNLERRGLVARVRRADDRRAVTVHLTDAGRSLIQAQFPEHARTIAGIFAVLDPEEQESLRTICRKLGRGLGADRPSTITPKE